MCAQMRFTTAATEAANAFPARSSRVPNSWDLSKEEKLFGDSHLSGSIIGGRA